MIKHVSEFDEELVPNLCGGEGEGLLRYAFHDKDAKSKLCACCTVTLQPGSSVGYHQHTEDDEIYYILSGVGSVNEGDGKRVKVFPGDAILTGNNGFHDMKNEGDEPLVFLATVISY